MLCMKSPQATSLLTRPAIRSSPSPVLSDSPNCLWEVVGFMSCCDKLTIDFPKIFSAPWNPHVVSYVDDLIPSSQFRAFLDVLRSLWSQGPHNAYFRGIPGQNPACIQFQVTVASIHELRRENMSCI